MYDNLCIIIYVYYFIYIDIADIKVYPQHKAKPLH